jgi:hypothetical protein
VPLGKSLGFSTVFCLFIVKKYSYGWGVIIIILPALHRPNESGQEAQRNDETDNDQNEDDFHTKELSNILQNKIGPHRP